MTEPGRIRHDAEHKAIEDRIREREELLNVLTEHAHDFIQLHDLDGRSVYASPSVERLYGRVPATLFELAHPDDRENGRQWWQHILDGGTHRLEWRVTDRSGRLRWLESSATLVQYRSRPHILTLSRCITDRKNADEAAKASEERLRLAFDAAKIGTGEMDIEKQLINLSVPMQRVVGVPPGTSTLSFADWLSKVIHPEHRDSVRNAVETAIAGDGRISLDYRIVWADGSVHWVTSRANILYDDAGKPMRMIGAIMDITDRKVLEDQLRQAQKMEAVGHLAGGVAHDFNNLLTIIRGNGEILLRSLPESDPNREMVAEITHAGERATALVQQLLAFSRRTVLEPRILDLNEIVRDSEKMLRRLIGEDVHFSALLDPAVEPVKTDPTQLTQVIMNLAINARDAMPTGGTLTIQTRNARFEQVPPGMDPDARPGRYALLAVTDTGVGMTPEVQAHIFEPFFTTKDTGKGTGLGLPMVYGIVKQSGGFIDVESTPGRGTTFAIYLPAAEGPVPPKKPAATAEPLARGHETILLVEDEDGVRSVVQAVLKRAGYTVLPASRGREALDIAANHAGPIHLVITDVVMPEMGGRQLVEQLTTVQPHLKVLYLSGHADDAVVRHGISESDVAFLQKPFAGEALTKKVRELLES